MPSTSKSRLRHALEIVIAFTPWVIAMYGFYWLHSSGTWTVDTPHRGKISVAILASGMALSFLVYSYFSRDRDK